MLALPRFYRFEGAPLPRSPARVVYRLLGETDLPSLYGSIDPYEDFAAPRPSPSRCTPSPWAARSGRISTAGRHTSAPSASCPDTGRCPEKTAFLESLLAAYSVR